MTRMYLKEIYYCSLHLRKNGKSMSNMSPTLNIMRNVDLKFLNTDEATWDTEVFNIQLTETSPGIYQYALDMSTFSNIPNTYTLIYKHDDYVQSEEVLFERKNRAKLV